MATGNPIGPVDQQDHSEEARRRVAILYRDQANSLRRRLKSRLGSSDEANEILQDAFARLLGARTLDALRDPGAFLNRIVRNLLIDRSRRRSVRPVHVEFEETDLAVAPEQGKSIELEEMRAHYADLVASLPPRMREVFLLHRIHGLGYKEIAGVLGISVRTAEWHVAEALVRIGRGLDRLR